VIFKVNIKRIGLLISLAAVLLLLAGCYMDGEDATTGNSGVSGNAGLPFDTIAPSATPTPTASPVPEATAVTGGSNISNINWDDGTEPSPTAPPAGYIITSPPSGGTVQPGQATATPTRTASTSGSQESGSGSLKSGSQGQEVSEVQQRLKELKYYTGVVDGKFGSATANAVKAFQAANGLTADGVVGAKTKEKLFSYYAVPYSASAATAKPAATQTPRPTATPNTANARYLKVGMSGSDVRQVQTRLIALGYLTGSADGNFGTATEAAVKAFQKQNKLWDDGIAGPDTQKALFASTAKKASGAASYVGGTLELGAEGDAVRAVQNRLIQLKYMTGYSDGSYGEKTKTAVEAFQRNNGLTADGKAGAATQAKLFASDAVDARGASQATAAATSGSSSGSSSAGSGASTGYTVLQEGDKGDEVRKLQQKLKDLKYYSGSVDGSFGAGTEAAVRAFQSAMKLVVDGKAGPATQRALYGENAKSEDTAKTLEYGMEGSAVTSLQYALYELGYYQDKINGVYSQNTVNAVREFQMNNSLTADGKAGQATQAVLYSPYARPVTVETPRYVTVRLGDKGEDVVQVQSTLLELGYSARRATGTFDDDTYNALIAFQRKSGLNADGVAGPETQAALFAPGAARSD
jgi:peptidoglycan hydrolase-like protein with peptidoglycan-binding domain